MHTKIQQALENSRLGPVCLAMVFAQGPKGTQLQAQFDARDGKLFFIPSMLDARGLVRERISDEVSADRFVELLKEHGVSEAKLNTAPSRFISLEEQN